MLNQRAIKLLQDLIEIESFSKNESGTAKRLEKWFQESDIPFQRKENNLWAVNKSFDPKKPTLLLNSHHDTVLPNKAYTRDPFWSDILDGKLYGLGSNDAGGALVSLLAFFNYFYENPNLKYNLLMVASAEEETAGDKSLRYLLPYLPKIDFAIIGEPTKMELAIAEKGLVVFDIEIKGDFSNFFNAFKLIWLTKCRSSKDFFIPIIPGPIAGWFGLFIVYQSSFLSLDYFFLGITFVIAISVFILDYIIPSIGAKKFGGSKSGVIGSTLGTIIGIIFLGPIGIIIGAFFGAYLGGYFFTITGEYTFVWLIDIILAIFAAIIHLPIKEKLVTASTIWFDLMTYIFKVWRGKICFRKN